MIRSRFDARTSITGRDPYTKLLGGRAKQKRNASENEADKNRQETVHTLQCWSAPHSGRFIPGTHRTGDRVGLTVGLDAVSDGGRTLQPSSPWHGISRLRAGRPSGFA